MTEAQVDKKPVRTGEQFTLIVLAAMVAVLGYVRLHLLPSQASPEPLEFAFKNPMLDAREGERVLFHPRESPASQQCTVVRPEGLVLRPNKGSERIGVFDGLRTSLPYLACSIREVRRGVGGTCEGPEETSMLYALNAFGMPLDIPIRVDSIRPRWMKWGERELAVYEVICQRVGTMEGRWTTYVAEQAPVTGLVKWVSLTPRQEVHYREILGASPK